jgi:hypothetical protein
MHRIWLLLCGVVSTSHFTAYLINNTDLEEFKILTTVYNTHNYCMCGLCPLSGTLNTRKHTISFHPQVSCETHSVGSTHPRTETPVVGNVDRVIV